MIEIFLEGESPTLKVRSSKCKKLSVGSLVCENDILKILHFETASCVSNLTVAFYL